MRLAYPPTTLRSRVYRCTAWLAVLLLLPVITAQGQTTPGTVEQEQTTPETAAPGQTTTGYVLPAPSLPSSLEPLRLRFFPPIDTTGNPRGILTPFLSIGERYDDNIFLTPSRDKVDDFITLPAAGIRLRYRPSLVTALDFDYRLDGEVFARHSEQNAISHQAEFRFASQLNPWLSFNVHDSFLSTTEPLQRFSTIDQATGLRQRSQQSRARTVRNNAGGTVEARVTDRVTADLLFESLIEHVDLSQEVDETRYSIGAEVGYLTDVARQSKAYVSYVVTFFSFDSNFKFNPNNPTAVDPCSHSPTAPDPCASFRVHTAMAGFRHYFTPTLSGNAALGYARTQSDDPVQDNFGTIAANLNVTKLLRDGQVTLGYNRGFISGGGAGGVVREDALLGILFWKATPKVTAIFAGRFALDDFQGQSRATNAGVTSDRSFLSLRPGLAYQLFPLWNLAFYYTYEYTNFYRGSPDIEDQRVTLISQLALRERLFLNVTYDYAVRHFRDIPVNGAGQQALNGLQPFARNQVMLLLTYAPTFRF